MLDCPETGATETASDLEWVNCLVVVQIQRKSASLDFRAYAEQIGGASVIDWAIGRLRAATAKVASFAVVADPNEHTRVRDAIRINTQTVHVDATGSGELRDLQRFAATCPDSRLLLIDLSAALLPDKVFHRLLKRHLSQEYHATVLKDTPCPLAPVLAEASFISDLARVDIPGLPTALRPALATLERAVTVASENAPTVRLGHLRVSEINEYRGKWPLQVRLRDPDDIAILRSAVADDGEAATDLLLRWPVATNTERTARLGRLRNPCQTERRLSERHRVLFAQVPSAFSGVEQVVHLLATNVPANSGAVYECAALIGSAGTFSARLAAGGVEVTVADRNFGANLVEHYNYSHRELSRLNPRIVHAHSIVGAPFCSAAVERGVPLIQHVHVANATGLQKLEDQIVHATEVVAVSDFVKGQVLRLGVDAAKVHVVRNGVPALRSACRAPEMVKRSCEMPPSARLVLMVARYSLNKRHDVAVEAFALLRAALPEAYLVLAGEAFEGDEPVLERVKRTVHQLGITSRVRFVGFWREMDALYSAADVLLLPSEDDPLPLTVLEAMSAGLPIVAARSGGTPEMIDDSVSGILAPAGDPRAFAAAIQEILLRRDLHTRLSVGAKERWTREFTLPRFVCDVIRMYDRVAGLPSQ